MEKINTKTKIIKFIKKRGKARVEDLRINLKISRQLIHRQLKLLVSSNLLIRTGTPPLVFYQFKKTKKLINPPYVSLKQKTFINKRFYWISPDGKIMTGFVGFKAWVDSIKKIKQLNFLAKEYVKVRKKADKYYSENFINVDQKIQKTFPQVYVDKTFYLDFYSLPKYGKTKLGQLVLYAKQGQKPALVAQIVKIIKPKIKKLIKEYKVNAVAFIPPTIPRQIQFLKELKKMLALELPEIQLVKAYRGEVPVAQKTLNKLEQRIENAKNTIFIKNVPASYESILLIDDAVGSGASLNETAKKLKKEKAAKKVVGFAIVCSYKGFDVIQEA